MGKLLNIPRKQSAYGDKNISYHFSGTQVKAKDWIDVIKEIKEKVEASFLFNDDSSDDEEEEKLSFPFPKQKNVWWMCTPLTENLKIWHIFRAWKNHKKNDYLRFTLSICSFEVQGLCLWVKNVLGKCV